MHGLSMYKESHTRWCIEPLQRREGAERSQSNIPLNFGLCSWNGEYKPAKPRKQNAQNLKWGYIPHPGEHKWIRGNKWDPGK